MAKKQNVKGLALIVQLASELGVNLKDTKVAIATDKGSAKARLYDGSLEVNLYSLNRPTVTVDSPRNPGIVIALVDHQRDLAPEDAIYCITAHMPQQDGTNDALNGDVYSVFVGPKGIILDESARRRVTELSE
ncbi:hypothetical protein J4402_02575 [Candidatus Pacearchaeota archaeon]|nr:hypothetical protein [Candidatus Pacearchaeota archaeon]